MNENDLLYQAITSGDATAVRALLEQEPGLVNARTPSGVAAVLFALYYGHAEISQIFLERGAQADIFSAAALGLTERIAELLRQDAALVNAEASDGFSPLGLASFFGQEGAAQLLLEAGAQVNRASNNPLKVMPLHSAAAGQHLGIAKALLARGALVNARQEGGFTPLMSAAQNGQLEMAQLLLAHGADRTAATEDGRTVLQFARESGSAELLALLNAG